jgi:PAS domain S-box-containing protein
LSAEIIFIYSVLFLIVVLIVLSLFRIITRFYIGKKAKERKDDGSKVGFVVDTFHDMVSTLKDKEKDLEILRQKAEDRALAIEGYNENILQSVPSGVMSFDENLKIMKVNQAAGKILEVNEETVIGKHHTEILGKPITDLLNEKKFIERGQISYITSSGKRIWLGLTLSPLRDQSGKTIGQILVFTDLTHLKAVESQMELRSRLSSLGELSAGIAHELRNPMGVIAGYTKLLSKKGEKSLQPIVENISKEIAVMDRIISDFLSFAKPAELTVTDIDLKAMIGNCITAIRGEKSDITVRLNIDGRPTIKGDEVFLRQAFINIIQNAVEAMPQRGALTIKAVPSAEPGHGFDIVISDTGHGISEDIIDKIFLPFFTTKERGTGLGLAIVHKIVVSHGGTISVESSDKGTTFRMRLPVGIL